MSRSASPRAAASGRRKPAPQPGRLRVLFFGEAATLAHVARPLALAAALPKDRYEVFLATPERYHGWAPLGVKPLPLKTQSPEMFAERLTSGRPLFSRARLEAYFRDDLELIEQVRPQVVVGDLRLSLAASARMARVPFVTISNACWSPERPLRPIRPVVGRFRGWPAPLAEAAFRLLIPSVLRWQSAPLNELLAAHGLARIGRDMRRVFTEADATLYADIPALFPEVSESPRHRFLGPVVWEPPLELPPWWDRLPENKPMAYLTLGSSGDAQLLQAMAGWLTGMGYGVIVATAGRAQVIGDEQSIFVADYVPGYAACERADLVVCNGGSPTTSQALLRGRPVLGVCSNMDQFLNMRAVQARKAGMALRADAVRRGRFEAAVNRLSGFRAMKAAALLASGIDAQAPGRILSETLDSLVSAAAGARPARPSAPAAD